MSKVKDHRRNAGLVLDQAWVAAHDFVSAPCIDNTYVNAYHMIKF